MTSTAVIAVLFSARGASQNENGITASLRVKPIKIRLVTTFNIVPFGAAAASPANNPPIVIPTAARTEPVTTTSKNSFPACRSCCQTNHARTNAAASNARVFPSEVGSQSPARIKPVVRIETHEKCFPWLIFDA
jgi:hypothetical protein